MADEKDIHVDIETPQDQQNQEQPRDGAGGADVDPNEGQQDAGQDDGGQDEQAQDGESS